MKRLLVLLFACTSSPAILDNTVVPASTFVHEDAALLAWTADHAVVMRVNGTIERELFASRYGHIEDISADGTLFIVSDTNLALYAYRIGDVEPTRLALEAAAVASLSPNARTVAFATFTAQLADSDDHITLVDLATHATRVLPAASHGDDGFVMHVDWISDDEIRIDSFHKSAGIDVATGARHPAPPAPGPRWYQGRGLQSIAADGRTCSGMTLVADRDNGILLDRGGGRVEPFLRTHGRKRGFHDHYPVIPEALFTPKCSAVLFQFDRTSYVADVATGLVGPLPASFGDVTWLRR